MFLSLISDKRPHSGCKTSSIPPTLVETTYFPAACASIILTGVPSFKEVNVTISSPCNAHSIFIIHEVKIISTSSVGLFDQVTLFLAHES